MEEVIDKYTKGMLFAKDVRTVCLNFKKERIKYYVLAVMCGILGEYLERKLSSFESKKDELIAKCQITDSFAKTLNSFAEMKDVAEIINKIPPEEFEKLKKSATEFMAGFADNFGGVFGDTLNTILNVTDVHQTKDKNSECGSPVSLDLSFFQDKFEEYLSGKNDPLGIYDTIMDVVSPIFDIRNISGDELNGAIEGVLENAWNTLKAMVAAEFLLHIFLGLEQHFVDGVPYDECFIIPETPELLALVHVSKTCTRYFIAYAVPFADKHGNKLRKINLSNPIPQEVIQSLVNLIPYVAPFVIMLIVHKLVLHFGLDREIKILEEMNEALAEYSKELQKLDLEQTEETVRIYREFSEKLYTFASEKELNDYLIGFMKENDIDFPYEGDFDEFMSNKVNAEGVMNILRFGF